MSVLESGTYERPCGGPGRPLQYVGEPAAGDRVAPITARLADKIRLAGAAALPAGAALPVALPRLLVAVHPPRPDMAARLRIADQIGRESGRERGAPSVSISVVTVPLNK